MFRLYFIFITFSLQLYYIYCKIANIFLNFIKPLRNSRRKQRQNQSAVTLNDFDAVFYDHSLFPVLTGYRDAPEGFSDRSESE